MAHHHKGILNLDVNNVNSCKVNTSNNKFYIIYTNADSLCNKVSDLRILLGSMNHTPDIIVITEVNSKQRKNKMSESEFFLENYNIFSANIGCINSRGIIIFVKNSLSAQKYEFSSNFEEFLFAEVRDSCNTSIVIGAIYRSPNSLKENNELLFELINNFCSNCKSKLIIVGDFNFPNIDWDLNSVKHASHNSPEYMFLKTINDNYLLQHVTEATRYRGIQTSNILDLIFTREDFVDYIDFSCPLGKSDHNVLTIYCDFTLNYKTNINKFNYYKGDYSSLTNYVNNELQKLNVTTQYNVPQQWTLFKSLLLQGTEKFIPVTTCNNNRAKSNSLKVDKDIKILIKKKHRLWTRFQETKNIRVFSEYKHVRNQV